MKWNLDKANIELFVFALGFILGGFFGYCTRGNKQASSPVEESKIDTLLTEREVIKIKVDELDSIKNAKIIEVTSLDNDSTVKLFYKLVKE